MTTEISATTLRPLPKIELHLHLEGAIPHDTFVALVNKYRDEGEPEFTREDLDAKLNYATFLEFIDAFVFLQKHIREAEDMERLTYDVLTRAKNEHGIVYVEFFYSPPALASQHEGLTLENITQAVVAGMQRAKADCGIRCNAIADLERHMGLDLGEACLTAITPFLGSDCGVIGIGIGGPEDGFPPEPYADIYAKARELGFRLTAHAGEAAGAESVWGAVRALNVERIGHGIRCLEDPLLVKHLAEQQIALEVCPVSNVATNVVKSVAEHPIRELIDAGLLVTVNSDDPTFFHTDIVNECAVLRSELGFSMLELYQLQLNALTACWLGEGEKEEVRGVLESWWASVL